MNPRKIITSTICATLALIMITTVSPAQTVGISNQRLDAPPIVILPSDSRAAKWSRFQSLAKDWKIQRGITSSIDQMSMLDPYQRIIGMGDDAIPLIVAQLKLEGSDPDHWFWALEKITGANPIRPEDRGNTVKMAQSWVSWTEVEGYAG
jgi:hypothetical protein